MVACLIHQPVDEVQTTRPSGERQRRLVSVFARQPIHDVVTDVGRVANDQIIPSLAESLEKVSALEPDAVLYSITCHIYFGDFQRAVADVAGINRGLGKGERQGNGDATTDDAAGSERIGILERMRKYFVEDEEIQ